MAMKEPKIGSGIVFMYLVFSRVIKYIFIFIFRIYICFINVYLYIYIYLYVYVEMFS